MSLTHEKDSLIIEMLENANHIAVVPSKIAGTDAFAASAGIYLALKDAEKNVSFLYPGRIPDGCETLIDKDTIVDNIKMRELVISVDYSETPATKVQYSTDDDILRLVLSTVGNNFTLANVNTELKGFDFDTIITVGVREFEDLGQTYRELEKEFRASKLINIDNTSMNTKFGTVDVVDTMEENLSLLVLNSMPKWGLRINSKSVGALLKGVEYRKLS